MYLMNFNNSFLDYIYIINIVYVFVHETRIILNIKTLILRYYFTLEPLLSNVTNYLQLIVTLILKVKRITIRVNHFREFVLFNSILIKVK